MNKKLTDSGLFASRLVSIEGPLVERYNRCLVQLGFTPTELTSFRIDGYGWSPEIAEEKRNHAYLSHGDANPFAIILTPKQAQSPVFYPFHNFDRKLMEYIYEDYEEQITEITATTAIMVDIDRYVLVLQSPEDLLKYDKISVKCIVLGNLIDGKKEQDKLIELFMEGDSFLTQRAQDKLLGNVLKYGDLRGKNIMMTPQTYDIASFYTRMFGGTYVFRDMVNKKPLLVLMSREWFEKVPESKDYTALHISDPKVITILKKRGYIDAECDAELLQRMRDWTFVAEISHLPREATISEIMDKTNKGLFVKYYEKYKDQLDKYKALQTGKIQDQLTGGCQPNSDLSKAHYELVWSLLTNIYYFDIFMLYKYNKEKFFKEFETFPADVQDWVVKYVVEQNNLFYSKHPRS